ncbi:MAG: hypothetical protein NTY09_05425 [bacterium]|nr:hypothetical protein [bacterium]
MKPGTDFNPFTRLIIGLLIFMFALWPATCATMKVKEVPVPIDKSSALTPAQAEGRTGPVEITGAPVIDQPLSVEIGDERRDIEAFWFRKSYYSWDAGDGGSEGKWSLNSTEESMARFKLGKIEVIPVGGSWRLEGFESEDMDEPNPDQTHTWTSYEWISADEAASQNLTVLGNISDNQIAGGDPFIITNSSNPDLGQILESGKAPNRILLTIISVIMFWIAFNLIAVPVLKLLNSKAAIGSGMRMGIGIGSLLVAIMWVWILQMFIK